MADKDYNFYKLINQYVRNASYDYPKAIKEIGDDIQCLLENPGADRKEIVRLMEAEEFLRRELQKRKDNPVDYRELELMGWRKTMMRIKLTELMQEQGFSVHTRVSITLHVAHLQQEQGDEIVKELEMVKVLIEMIESGTTEQEFRKIAQEKYGVTMLG